LGLDAWPVCAFVSNTTTVHRDEVTRLVSFSTSPASDAHTRSATRRCPRMSPPPQPPPSVVLAGQPVRPVFSSTRGRAAPHAAVVSACSSPLRRCRGRRADPSVTSHARLASCTEQLGSSGRALFCGSLEHRDEPGSDRA